MLQNVFQELLVVAERPQLGLLITIASGLTNMILDAYFIAVLRLGVVELPPQRRSVSPSAD